MSQGKHSKDTGHSEDTDGTAGPDIVHREEVGQQDQHPSIIWGSRQGGNKNTCTTRLIRMNKFTDSSSDSGQYWPNVCCYMGQCWHATMVQYLDIHGTKVGPIMAVSGIRRQLKCLNKHCYNTRLSFRGNMTFDEPQNIFNVFKLGYHQFFIST